MGSISNPRSMWNTGRMAPSGSTNLFDENGVCFVKLEDGSNTLYLTVRYGNGYSYSNSRYE